MLVKCIASFSASIISHLTKNIVVFPHSSVGKESTCNAGDPSLIPELERYAGEEIGYPLQYPWALVAQLVKNPPAMWETWVRSLGLEDPLEKGKATHSSLLAWRIPWTVKQTYTPLSGCITHKLSSRATPPP